MLKSLLLDRALSQLSGEKTELIYHHYWPFYNCSSIMFIFWPKNVQQDVHTVKKTKLICNLFPERKMILKKLKRIRSCTKMA